MTSAQPTRRSTSGPHDWQLVVPKPITVIAQVGCRFAPFRGDAVAHEKIHHEAPLETAASIDALQRSES